MSNLEVDENGRTYAQLHQTERGPVYDFVTKKFGHKKGEALDEALNRVAQNASWVNTIVTRSRRETGKPAPRDWTKGGPDYQGTIKDILDRVDETPELQR